MIAPDHLYPDRFDPRPPISGADETDPSRHRFRSDPEIAGIPLPPMEKRVIRLLFRTQDGSRLTAIGGGEHFCIQSDDGRQIDLPQSSRSLGIKIGVSCDQQIAGKMILAAPQQIDQTALVIPASVRLIPGLESPVGNEDERFEIERAACGLAGRTCSR